MTLRRVVTDLTVTDLTAATAFYVGVLGMVVAMDHGWIARSSTRPTGRCRSA